MAKINKGKSLEQIKQEIQAVLKSATDIAATEAVKHFKPK